MGDLTSKQAGRLVSDISALIEMSEELRQTLTRYKRANRLLATRVGGGEMVLDAFDALGTPMRRHRELTEVMDEFEAARHRVRLSLFALAESEGASKSEVARRLGISRQLASRLAVEARQARRHYPPGQPARRRRP